MNAYVELVVSIFTAVSIVVTLFYAILRFGIKRELHTFMRISADAKTVGTDNELALVSVTVHLENKGGTRINARRGHGTDGWLYKKPGDPDQCHHAGTLKIRQVPSGIQPLIFDWYSLPRLHVAAHSDAVHGKEVELEQINYLDEFQDPEGKFKDVHFWLEPRESYDLPVYVWLRPGIYVAKAFFLGAKTRRNDEEYWSCRAIFSTEAAATAGTGRLRRRR